MTQPIPAQRISQPQEQDFIDIHFAKIAFTISTIVLFILAPLSLFLGTAIGVALHCYFQMRLDPEDRIMTVPNVAFVITGATAAVLSLTPAGAGGGFLFQAIPFLSSLAVGSTVYRAFSSIFQSPERS